MNVNEVRIGNWVWVEGEEIQVDQIGDFFDQYPVKFINSKALELVRPIPISEEWLLKLGYVKCTDDHLSERCGNLYEKHTIYYSPVDDHDLHYVDESYGGEHEFHWKYFISWESLIQVTNVHQLQNLYFALTNKEL